MGVMSTVLAMSVYEEGACVVWMELSEVSKMVVH